MSRPVGLPVLTYHAIGDGRSVTSTPRAWFRETLRTLRGAGWVGVDLGDWITRGLPPSPGCFAVAFDDGLRSFLDVAEDLVEQRTSATIFLVTDRVGLDNAWPGQRADVPRERLLSWPEVLDLASAGFRFGAHGRTHARLDRCSPSKAFDELKGSRDAVEQAAGRACRLAAYPYGESSASVRSAASGLFDAAFGTRLDEATAFEDRHDLSRIDAFYLRSWSALDAFAEGRWQGRLRARRILRGVKNRFLRTLPPMIRHEVAA